MKFLSQLLKHNREWAKSQLDAFQNDDSKSHPMSTARYLFVTDLDSRLPFVEMLGLKKDEFVVYQNVGNMVRQDDMSFQTSVQYAIEVLGVEHIIICGKNDCSFLAADSSGKNFDGILEYWLTPFKKIIEDFAERLSETTNEDEQLALLCELNVIEQVASLCRTYPVHLAWRHKKKLSVHGWSVDVKSGLIKDLEVTYHGLNDLPEDFFHSNNDEQKRWA